MNKYMLLALFAIVAQTCVAQIEFGLKTGLNTTDIESRAIIFNDSDTNLEIEFTEAQYGIHLGLYTRIKIAGIFIEPAALLNSSSVTYKLTELDQDDLISSFKSEQFTNLDIPFMIGMKFSFLRLQLGPVAHINLSSTSELLDVNGYKQKFKTATYGYQFGAGLDIWKLRFDVAFEGNLSKFGDHITIKDTDLSFDESATRLLFTLGYKF